MFMTFMACERKAGAMLVRMAWKSCVDAVEDPTKDGEGVGMPMTVSGADGSMSARPNNTQQTPAPFLSHQSQAQQPNEIHIKRDPNFGGSNSSYVAGATSSWAPSQTAPPSNVRYSATGAPSTTWLARPGTRDMVNAL